MQRCEKSAKILQMDSKDLNRVTLGVGNICRVYAAPSVVMVMSSVAPVIELLTQSSDRTITTSLL